MASAIDTARAEAGTPATEDRPRPRLRLVGSRLGALILILNLLSLLILFGGALALNEWRRGLVEARQESLLSQAELLANVLGELEITQGEPRPILDELEVPKWLRDTFIPSGQRASVHNADGLFVADSYQVSDQIPGRPLPPIGSREMERMEAADPASDPDVERARAELAREVEAALGGEPQVNLRRSETGERLVSVSVPIRHVRQVLGVLTLEAADVDAILAAQRAALMPFALVALAVSLLSSLMLHLFVARPIMRLSAAADQVRMQRARAISFPDLEGRRDEIGDLARSLETMTTTLSERMDAIERFAADVSHEIKNPLTSIRSALETLDLVKTPEQRDRLTALLQNDVRRLDRLITDISNASRLDAELARDRLRPLDLNVLLSEVIGVYRDAPRRDAAPVVFAPGAPSPARMAGRDGPLGQVFRNLIDNALSFSPAGGSVRVALSRDDEGGGWRVVVEDDGPGIPADNLETVFERFYTSRPKGTAFGGNSGLGLSIVRQIVEAHGGRVWAENRVDDEARTTGARFTVVLPVAGTRG
ncbi:MAG: sensor histidine kinase [Caulobacteraceae bacterium]|nr:sensor histidine kinase [Caulobacteraceae bacterium]